MLLFSLAWQGWIYIFYLLILTSIVYLLVSKYLSVIKPMKNLRNMIAKRNGSLNSL